MLAWGFSLFIHLIILLYISNVFTSGMKKGDGGAEYDVGIVAGSQTGGLDIGTAQTLNTGEIENLQPIEQPAFEPDVVREVQLELANGTLKPSSQALSADQSTESLYKGQALGGQGQWAGLQGSGGPQGTGGASFFGLEAKGGKFVFVVDRSGSMSGSPMEAAKSEIIRSIMSLDDNMEVCVLFYDDNFLMMDDGRLLKASKANKNKILSWVGQVASGGGTDPSAAMAKALSLKPDAIWLLSDGQFSSEIATMIGQQNHRGRVMIPTIAFFSREGEAVLRQIATENRGRYQFIKQP